jgi:thioredoxin reductase (NADPH)
MMPMNFDIIVVGTGPAGLSAAVYASRHELKTLLIGEEPGGYVNEAPIIDNYLGFSGIKGHDLVNKFFDHAKSCNLEILKEKVIDIKKHGKEFIIKTDKNEFTSKAVIIAMGSRRRELNVPGEIDFKGSGISYCATCDGLFFKNKTVGVCGSGDSAMATALMLADYTKNVHIFVRGNNFSGKESLATKIKEHPKIEVHFDAVVREVKGDKRLKEVILSNNKSIALDGLFVSIGMIPNSEIAERAGVKLDKDKTIDVNCAMKTNVEGVFAAGDITNGCDGLRQIIIAAAQGAIAATSAYKYLRQ